MKITESLERRGTAADELDRRENRTDGVDIANSLDAGLTTLRSLLFHRVHDDVQKSFGVDSMLIPASLFEAEIKAKGEIEIFQIAESTEFVRTHGYVSDPEWYRDWLGTFRIGEGYATESIRQRILRYETMSDDARRLEFSSVLEKTIRDASRAPLVLYRLVPLAIGIVTAVAFGQRLDAAELRNQQAYWLPSISDCHECHGRPLDNGETCEVCGNPVWKYEWLTAAD